MIKPRWRATGPAGSTASSSASKRRASARGLAFRYAAGLAGAYLLAVTDASAIVIPIGQTGPAPQTFFVPGNLLVVGVLVLVATIAVAAGGLLNLRPALRWFAAGRGPNSQQRQTAMRLVSRQSLILSATWAVSGAVFIALNFDQGLAIAVPTLLAVVFGSAAAASISLLLTQRALRPILLAAAQGSDEGVTAPGVLARLVTMWLVCSALPCAAILALIFVRSHGWLIHRTASVDTAVVVVSLAAVLLGLPAMILTSRSISDPVREVVDAMAEVEQGRLGTVVGVYERSELGRLQNGFNRMITGLSERDRLRDLFGRHVGADVARRALEDGASLSGEVRDAAILFIDLVGSTKLAANRPPQEVAEILNEFFETVVSTVDERQGSINKFQGDAALAVFGVPLPIRQPSSAALASARALRSQLARLPLVDFGIGVTSGPVFAGNIGAENRYEYTVIGDVVNEAARLADFAKTVAARVVCSADAVEHADRSERRHWTSHGETVLRGRSEHTRVWTPGSAGGNDGG